MFRSKVLVGAIAAATVGMSSVALANGGSYEPDYGTPAPMNADGGAGFYLGLQAGYALTHWDNIQTSALDVPDTVDRSKVNGFAGRVFAGYAFNKYLGLEGGWTYLPNRVRVKEKSGALKTSTRINNWAADASFVLNVPVIQQFGVYSKVGLGFFRSTNALRLANSNHTVTIKRGNMDSWNVTFGAGAYYDVTSNIRATAGWRRFEGNPHISDHYQPNPDVFLVGLQYRFPFDVFGTGSV